VRASEVTRLRITGGLARIGGRRARTSPRSGHRSADRRWRSSAGGHSPRRARRLQLVAPLACPLWGAPTVHPALADPTGSLRAAGTARCLELPVCLLGAFGRAVPARGRAMGAVRRLFGFSRSAWFCFARRTTHVAWCLGVSRCGLTSLPVRRDVDLSSRCPLHAIEHAFDLSRGNPNYFERFRQSR
jgi:hypothetical protein